MTAIDLADQLAADYNLSFREMYRIIAELVRENEQHGTFDFETSRKILANHKIDLNISIKRWEQMLSPERLVGRRKSFGGPAPSAVRDTIGKFDAGPC